MRRLFVILVAVFGMSSLNAQHFTYGYLNYTVNDDGVSVTVTGHVNGINASGRLSIPESVSYNGNSYAVTDIGYAAFRQCSRLFGPLVIPNSVVTIGFEAFRHCSGFESLKLGNHVTTIGEGAFRDCSGFTGSLIIPNSVIIIGMSAFCKCSGFTGSLTIPNSVIEICHAAFAHCYGFKGFLNLGNSVVTIGSHAFSSDDFIGSLVIPESVDSIGYYAFAWDENFTSLVISNSVSYIGDNAFAWCSGLTGKLIIPNSVNYIGNEAFAWCSGFTEAESLAVDPPVLGGGAGNPTTYHVFEGFGCSTITVPCGSKTAYNHSTWHSSSGSGGSVVSYGFNTIIEYCESLDNLVEPRTSVYPNPAKDFIKIELSDNSSCQSIEIYSIDGRLVETFPETSHQTTINIGNLTTGIYIMKVRLLEGREYAERIVKE